jgi:hypothetical protein
MGDWALAGQVLALAGTVLALNSHDYNIQERLPMRFFLVVTALVMLVLDASAQAVPTEGSSVSGTVSVGRSTFALPPGEWKVVATGSGSVGTDVGTGSSQGAQNAVVFLVQLSNGTFAGSMQLRAPLSSTQSSAWSDSLCDRKDTLFRDTLSGNVKFPECLLINHLTAIWTVVPKGDFDRKIYDWLKANNVKLPKTALLAAYVKYAGGDYVLSRFVVNPELLGQDPAVNMTWAENEWHPLVIKNDPKRMAFVENFKKWSMVMVDNSRSTLANRKPLNAPLPSLDELRVK